MYLPGPLTDWLTALGAGWEQLPHSRNATGGLLEDRVKFPGGMGATADCAALSQLLPSNPLCPPAS